MTRRFDDDPIINELVTVYHRYGVTNSPDDFWAWDRVGEIIRGSDVEQAWQLVVALIRASTDERLPYVGAGPVEDLVVYHAPALIDLIEGEAQRDPRFRDALASIWLIAEDLPPAILARLQTATGGAILVQTQAEIDAANREFN